MSKIIFNDSVREYIDLSYLENNGYSKAQILKIILFLLDFSSIENIINNSSDSVLEIDKNLLENYLGTWNYSDIGYISSDNQIKAPLSLSLNDIKDIRSYYNIGFIRVDKEGLDRLKSTIINMIPGKNFSELKLTLTTVDECTCHYWENYIKDNFTYYQIIRALYVDNTTTLLKIINLI